jgi:hypothetical protein
MHHLAPTRIAASYPEGPQGVLFYETLFNAYSNASSAAKDLTTSFASTKEMLSRSRKKVKSSQKRLDGKPRVRKYAKKQIMANS